MVTRRVTLPPVIYLIEKLKSGALVKMTVELPSDQTQMPHDFDKRVRHHFGRFVRAVSKP